MQMSAMLGMSKAGAIQKLLAMYLTAGLRGVINVRISNLVNVWARRACGNACRRLEWRLSQAKLLLPEPFLPEVVWEWEDLELHCWREYSRQSCLELEKTLAKEPEQSVNLKENGSRYKVWVNSRKHIDLMSGESRRCRRRAPMITYVTLSAGLKPELIDFHDKEIGFRGGMDAF